MKKIIITFITYLVPFFAIFLVHLQLYAQTPTVSDVNRCGAGTVALTAAGAPAGGSYRWYNVATGGTPIVGANTASFTTPTLTATTDFFVSSVAADGTTESGRARATVNVRPLPNAQILEGAIIGYCNTTTISLNAASVGGATYQWQRFSPIGGGSFQNETGPGSTSTSYNVSSPTAGFFRIAVTGTNGCTAFSPVIEVVTNYTPEAVILQGTTGSVCSGQPFLLQAKTDELSVGNAYQWTFSANNTTYSNVAGATTSSLSAMQAGFYKLQATKNNCVATSPAIQLTQVPAPTATIQQGMAANFCAGGDITLTAQTDIGTQFQWLVGLTAAGPFAAASGASTGMTYRTTASGFYVVDISKDGCTTRSVPTQITQADAPVAQITNVSPTSFCTGGSITLEAQAVAGNVYQWKFSATAGGTFANIAGATAASYATMQAGFYVLEVRKTGCTLVDASAPIQVRETRSVIQEAPTASICAGTSTTLRAVTSPGATYRWLFSPTVAGTFSNASGTNNNPTYTTNVIGYYRLDVTRDGCTHSSVPVNVIEKSATIAQGASTTFCRGSSVVLAADQTGMGLTYAWTYSTTSAGTYSAATGTNNAATYSADRVGFYKLTIVDGSCTNTSDAISLTESPTQPTATILQGSVAQFCIDGDVTINTTQQVGAVYSWKYSPTMAGTYVAASGANNTATYVANTAGFYTVQVSNGGCSVTSPPVNITQINMIPKPTFSQGGTAFFCTAGNVKLQNLLVLNNVTYQWQYSATVGGTYSPASGINNRTDYTTSQEGFYKIRITSNTCGSNTSDAIEVRESINLPVAQILQASPAQFCAAGDVTLEAQTGTGYTYLWQYGMTATGTFADAGGTNTQASYSANQVGFYRVQVSLGGCVISSTPVQTQIAAMTPKPIIEQGVSASFCDGGSVNINTTMKGAGYTYQWQFATTATGTYANASGMNTNATYAANAVGFYRVVVTIPNCGSSTSDNIQLTQSSQKPVATILQGSTAVFCIGADVIIEAVQGVGFNYQWKFSTTASGTYTNATGTSNTASYTASVAGFYTVEVSLNGCSETSQPIAVTSSTVLPKPIIAQGANATFCQGRATALNTQTRSSRYSYQWQYSATAGGPYSPASGINNRADYNTNQEGFYKIQITSSSCGSNLSDAVELRESTDLPIAKILQVSPIQFCVGGDVTLEAQTGTGYTYLWQYGMTATGTFANANGTNTQASYRANQVGFYRVQVSLGGCVIISTPVQTQTTTMTPKPVIEQGTSASFCDGGSININTTMKGTGYTYQWQFATTATGTYANASGMSTSAIYAVNAAGFYRVAVTIPNCGSNTSDNIEITQSSQKPVATILQGATAVFCTGADVILDAVQGVGFTYQWKFSTTAGGTYANATGTSNLANYTASTAGFYIVEVSLNGCKETSQPIAVTSSTMMPKPIIAQGANAAFCEGSSLDLTIQARSSRYTYRWEFATTATGTYSPASGVNNRNSYPVSTAGFYRLVASSPTCGSATSDVTQVKSSNVIPTAKILQGASAVFCAGADVTLDAETGIGYTYNWQFSATATGTFTDAVGDNKKATYPVNTAGFYRVVVGFDGCSATSIATNVTTTTTMPKPVIAQGSIVTFCAGGNISLSALTKSTKYTYQWLFSTTATGTFANASGMSTADSYSTSQAGFYRLRTTSATCGTANSDPTELKETTEKPNAVIIQAPTAQFCSTGGDVILEAEQEAGYTYRWRFSTTATGTYSNASGTNNRPAYTTNVAGFYVVEVSLNACVATSEPVQVSSAPTMPQATTIQTGVVQICKGESTTLSAKSKGTNYQYQWLYSATASGTFANASGSSNSPDYAASLYGFYRLRTSLPDCGTSTSATIQVKEASFIPSTNILQFPSIGLCVGGDVSLEVTPEPEVTYSWFFSDRRDGIYRRAEGNSRSSLYNATRIGFYRVSASLGGACIKTSEAVEVRVITTLPEPTITPRGRVFFCRGGNAELKSLYKGTRITYQWQFSSSATGTFANVNNGTTANFSATQVGFYRLTISSTGCGSGTSTVIEVAETTVLPVATILQGRRAEFCLNGGDALLEAETNPSYNYQWKYAVAADSAFVNATGTSNQATYLTNRAGFYVLEVSVNGCKATSQATQVVGVTTLSKPNILQGLNAVFCEGSIPVLQTTTKGTGYVYRWTFSASATGNFEQVSGNANVATYNNAATGFYRLEISRDGCGSNISDVISVSFKPNPTLTFSTPKTIETCEGANVQLGVNEISGATYSWRGANNFTSSLSNPIAKASGDGFYVLTISANGCSVTDSISVTIKGKNSFTATASDNICANERNGIIRLSSAATNLQYRLGTTGNFQVVTSFNSLAVGTYTVFSKNEFGCESTQTVIIKSSKPAGQTVNGGSDVSIQKGKAVRLLASGVKEYKWTPIVGLSDPTIADPVANPLRTTTYTVTGKDETGCETFDEVVVTVNDNGDLVVTNLMTPDNNGINDTWEIVNIELYPDAEIKVFDRWGLEVFSTIGYNNTWNGKSKSGDSVPDGAYYYQISVTIRGQRQVFTGAMNIMR